MKDNETTQMPAVSGIIPVDHPSLAGHFPGNPVVPGVVLLEQVIDSIRQACPESAVSGFSAVKFTSILLPGQEFIIQLQAPLNHKIKFTCSIEDRTIASGQAVLVPMEDMQACESDRG